jgi:hypothetical protein
MLQPPSTPFVRLAFALLTLSFALSACAPALDWREMRPEGTSLQTQFPCKPVPLTRKLPVAGEAVALTLLACNAGNVTWGLAHATFTDPARIGPALAELREATLINMKAGPAKEVPYTVPGATPNAQSKRVQVTGELPDKTAVVADVAVFTYGLNVYQVSALGKQLHGAHIDPFFNGLRVAP